MKKVKLLIIALAIASLEVILPSVAYAADIVVAPAPGSTYGGHEIWAHSEMGQSFVAIANNVKAGFWVEYSPSSALLPPNAPETILTISLYGGENLDPDNLLNQQNVIVNSDQLGFLDVDYAALGIQLEVGHIYTLGISSLDNRGWIIPSVCDNKVNKPTGIYTDGHPFLNGQIVIDETGICDNAFHVIDSTIGYTVTNKKVEIKGEISEIGENWIYVKRSKVYFDTNTIIVWNDNSVFELSQVVQVKGYRNTDGTVTASYIELK